MIVVNSRLIYIDSEINTIGNRSKAKVLLPSHPFSVYQQDRMRLTLVSFEMRRNWYSINATNQVFYVYTASAGTYQQVVIPAGSYDTFAELALAIQAGLQVVLPTATCAYADTSRKFTFALTGAALDAVLVSFQVKEALPAALAAAGVSVAGYFQDSHEILGLIPTRTSTPVNGTDAAGAGNHVSPFVGALNTLEAIYLRTNLMGGNFQTYGHERYLPDRNGVTDTQIFARIPLERASYDEFFPFVTFEDTNDLFVLNLQQKSLDSLELHVTDDKGRLLAEVDPRQADLGLMSFKVVLKWEHLTSPPPPPFAPNLSPVINHVPQL
jgi:hypothetical protein